MNITIKQRAELRRKAAVRQGDIVLAIGYIAIILAYAALIYFGVV